MPNDTETEFLIHTAEHAGTTRTSQRVPQARHWQATRLGTSLCNVACRADAARAVMIVHKDAWQGAPFSQGERQKQRRRACFGTSTRQGCMRLSPMGKPLVCHHAVPHRANPCAQSLSSETVARPHARQQHLSTTIHGPRPEAFPGPSPNDSCRPRVLWHAATLHTQNCSWGELPRPSSDGGACMSFFCRTKNALYMPRRAAGRRAAAPADICASAPRRACGAAGTAPVGNSTSALHVFRSRRRRFAEAPSTAAATCDVVCPRCKRRGTCKNLSSCHECNRHGHCCCDHAPRRPRAPPRGPKTDMGVQCDIDCNDQTLHARELHDTHATTMLRPQRSNEQVRSTPLPQRAEARLRHAENRPAPRSDPCARQRGKEHLPPPSVRSRFLQEKVRSGKCVFLSVGLLIFGRFSGPGKPGALSGPRKDHRRTGARESPDAQAPKKGTRQCSRRPRESSCGFFKNL